MTTRAQILARQEMLTQRVAEVFDEFGGRAGAARIAEVLTSRGLPTNKQAVRLAMRKHGLRAARLPLPREELTERVIATFHTQRGEFGARRVAIELARDGVPVSEATVANILRERGLRAQHYRGPGTGPTQHGPVRLTSNPLQRVGAWALMVLAGVDDPGRGPESLTPAEVDTAVAVMSTDVADTADMQDTKAPGSFWLAASYLLWPNSPMNHAGRTKIPPAQRRQRIQRWRTYPTGSIGVPCSLCGLDACGWYGKVDIPLGAPIHHHNTTPPGHQGQPLCPGCLASLHALPYGCHISPTAYALHSWDDHFLRRAVTQQVGQTREQAQASGPLKAPGRGAREAAALGVIARHDQPFTSDVELIGFSNNNRDPYLRTWALAQPLAEWLRCTLRDPRSAATLDQLAHMIATPESNANTLAWLAFRAPDRILTAAAGRLGAIGLGNEIDARTTAELAGLCISLARVL